MGLLRWIFNRILVRKLKNDPKFLKSVAAHDKTMERLQKSIRELESKGVKIPDSMKRSAGMEP